MKLVLASRSPQRVKLLRDAGYEFEIDPADIDEEVYPRDLLPANVARWLATEKAKAIALKHPGSLVLGADTVVALGTRLLGKPEDDDHARKMLGDLSGSTHDVFTGVAIIGISQSIEQSATAHSQVSMRTLTATEIQDYVASGNWRGKAGGYGIQDQDPFVTCMTGSVTNIIGLPMELVASLFDRVGFKP